MAQDNLGWLRVAGQLTVGAAKLGFGAYQMAQANKKPDDLTEQHDPMAGMATGQELSRFAYDPDGFYLGRIHEDHGADFEASIPSSDDRHIFIVAGSASGKGVTYGLQNALRWKGGFFGIDPKGEMAEIAGMRRGTRDAAKGSGTAVRQFLGQKVAILDPMGQVRGAAKKFRVNYDPMTDIPSDQRTARKIISKLAAGMIMPESGDAAHFSQSAETLTAGVLEAVKMLEKPHNHCLPFVRQKILGNVKLKDETKPAQGEEKVIKAGFEILYDYLTDERLPDDGHAAEAASVLGEVLGSDEAGSFRTTLSRNLKWMIDLDIQDHLKPSDFSLWKALQESWSVFVVLSPDDVSEFKNWLRINVQMALSAKMAQGTNQAGLQTLFFLDEFPVLGRFKEIEEKAGYIRGYGVKLVGVIQYVAQLQQLYEKNWEAIIANSAAMIAWGTNDEATEEYLSKRVGKVVVSETSYGASGGMSGGAGSTGHSSNQSLRERMIRFSNEIREQGARETMRAFVIPASGKAFTVRRVPYMELASHKIFDSPEQVLAWEKARKNV